ncbi:hypothetical protein B0H13DRAFT_1851421 [Mycena leptocephala]|nr:hypothetical protein B0H13DRAFT_1851421 [Mycena leptocephala]
MHREDGDGEREKSEEEVAEEEALAEATRVARFALHKIRKFAFAVVHSPTVLLPLWRSTCVSFDLNARLIPRDVSTRWREDDEGGKKGKDVQRKDPYHLEALGPKTGNAKFCWATLFQIADPEMGF